MNIEEHDMQILKQLYFGNHLEPNELDRAKDLVNGLRMELGSRLTNEVEK